MLRGECEVRVFALFNFFSGEGIKRPNFSTLMTISDCVSEKRINALIKDIEEHRVRLNIKPYYNGKKYNFTCTRDKKFGGRVLSIRRQGRLIKNRIDLGKILYDFGFQLHCLEEVNEARWKEYFDTGTLSVWP